MSVGKPLTKSELLEALKAQDKRFKKYVDDVAQEILKAVSDHDEVINSRLDDMELKFVTREEFEALKRKVDRYHIN